MERPTWAQLLEPIVKKLSHIELCGEVKVETLFVPMLYEGSEAAEPLFQKINPVLQAITTAYRGGGKGTRYPHESIRYKLPFASSITLTISYPNQTANEMAPEPTSGALAVFAKRNKPNPYEAGSSASHAAAPSHTPERTAEPEAGISSRLRRKRPMP